MIHRLNTAARSLMMLFLASTLVALGLLAGASLPRLIARTRRRQKRRRAMGLHYFRRMDEFPDLGR